MNCLADANWHSSEQVAFHLSPGCGWMRLNNSLHQDASSVTSRKSVFKVKEKDMPVPMVLKGKNIQDAQLPKDTWWGVSTWSVLHCLLLSIAPFRPFQFFWPGHVTGRMESVGSQIHLHSGGKKQKNIKNDWQSWKQGWQLMTDQANCSANRIPRLSSGSVQWHLLICPHLHNFATFALWRWCTMQPPQGCGAPVAWEHKQYSACFQSSFRRSGLRHSDLVRVQTQEWNHSASLPACACSTATQRQKHSVVSECLRRVTCDF